MLERTTPDPPRSEHRELREALLRAEKMGGRTGPAAVAVMRVLFPHMVMEQQYAMPPLRLLPRLVRGEVTPDMRPIISTAESLKAELPKMLEEHRQIVLAMRELMRAATEENLPEYVQFASKMIAHAQQEEEMLYPAAILVGEYVKLKLGKA